MQLSGNRKLFLLQIANLKNIIRKAGRFLQKLIKYSIFTAGVIAIIAIILSFTTLPFWGYYWLGTSVLEDNKSPEYIIVMGGSAMPGKSGLMRTFYAAEIANKFPTANILIALPGDLNDEESSLNQMKKELEIRNVPSQRIAFENQGKNTRFQVLEIKKIIPNDLTHLTIVTSPEHMRRAILAFKKVGYQNVNGIPAFDEVHDFDLIFDDDRLGGKNKFVPEIGDNIKIRYQFWKHLEYEVIFTREIIALGYYRLKGWI